MGNNIIRSSTKSFLITNNCNSDICGTRCDCPNCNDCISDFYGDICGCSLCLPKNTNTNTDTNTEDKKV